MLPVADVHLLAYFQLNDKKQYRLVERISFILAVCFQNVKDILVLITTLPLF